MSEQPPNLRIVRCCGSCVFMSGWLDNAWCNLYTLNHHDNDDFVQIQPYQLCDSHQSEDQARALAEQETVVA
jgi:hypothetical protein